MLRFSLERTPLRLLILALILVAMPACGSTTTTQDAAPANSSAVPSGTTVAASGAAPSDRPAATGLSGRIVYNTPDGHIWAVNADGSNRVQLTHAAGNDFDPSWSPDGKQVVFRTERGIYAPDKQRTGTEGIFIVNADGTGEHQLYPPDDKTPGGLFPDWSPDSKRIAFSSVRSDGAEAIFLINVDGTGRSDLSVPNNSGECAEWSPDSSKIMFCSHNGEGDWQVWVMNVDGSNQVQLTHAPASKPNGAGGNNGAIWSPDGSQIAFSSDRDGNGEVYVMNADGSQQRRLTNMPGSQSPQVWLPDGRIVFDDWSAGKELPDWYVMKADGSDIATLAALQGGNSPIDWHP